MQTETKVIADLVSDNHMTNGICLCTNECEECPKYPSIAIYPISHRLLAISDCKDAAAFPFLPAKDFGVTELQCMNFWCPIPHKE